VRCHPSARISSRWLVERDYQHTLAASAKPIYTMLDLVEKGLVPAEEVGRITT